MKIIEDFNEIKIYLNILNSILILIFLIIIIIKNAIIIKILNIINLRILIF